MTRIGYVTEINAVKEQLADMQKEGLIKEWEVPHEDLLTRLTAAIFFLAADASQLPVVWTRLQKDRNIQYKPNEDYTLSKLTWRFQIQKMP